MYQLGTLCGEFLSVKYRRQGVLKLLAREPFLIEDTHRLRQLIAHHYLPLNYTLHLPIVSNEE